MKKLILAALVAAGISRAETICGKVLAGDHGVTIRVACVDVEKLAAVGVTLPGVKSQTQLLIDVPDGVAVDVTLGDQKRLDRVYLQQDGVRRALVIFDGIDHESLPEVVVLVAK